VDYAFTEYFTNKVLAKRPYLTARWCFNRNEKRCKMTASE
jgi:uncharacterized protein YqgQ